MARAGVTCDARPLSRSFFEPSALPLPWSFCRTRTLRNFGERRAESTPGGWVFCPASRRFLLLYHPNFRGENGSPRQRPTNGPTPCFCPSEVYGCHRARWRGTNRRTGADRGLPDFRAADWIESRSYWQEKPCWKIGSLLFILKLFRETAFARGSPLLITPAQFFPGPFCLRSNFSKLFSFGERFPPCCYSFYSFISPTNPGGVPSAKWRAVAFHTRTFCLITEIKSLCSPIFTSRFLHRP